MHLFIDEINIHISNSPLIGNAPFKLHNSDLISEWSNLDPGDKITLWAAVSPHSSCYKEAHSSLPEDIEDNNLKRRISTVVMQKVLRSSQKIHDFIKFLENKVTTENSYNVHPDDEERGHESQMIASHVTSKIVIVISHSTNFIALCV